MPDFGRWTSNGGDPSLNEINRSEKFLEALSLEHQVYATDREEAELAVLMAGWRDEARRTPMAGIATPRDAVAALDKATGRGRVRFPMALVGSVAAAMLCLGGFGAAVYGSGPGDALYGVRGLFFGGPAVTRDVGVELASNELQQVQQLIDDGNWEEAQQRLQTITTTVATVDDVQRKQELVDQWQQLSVKVESRDPHATVPPDAPPVVLPEVTVTVTTTPSSPADILSGDPTSPTSPTTATTSAPTTTGSGGAEPGPDNSETSQPPETSAPSTSTPRTTESSGSPTSLPATSSPATSTSVPSSSSTPTTSLPVPSTSTAPQPVEPTRTVSDPTPTSSDAEPPAHSAPQEHGGGDVDSDQGDSAGPAGVETVLPDIDVPLLPGMGNPQR